MSTEDPITGPWHDGPPEDPMEFTTEFRWELVPTGEKVIEMVRRRVDS